jgi:hypothetical protein
MVVRCKSKDFVWLLGLITVFWWNLVERVKCYSTNAREKVKSDESFVKEARVKI